MISIRVLSHLPDQEASAQIEVAVGGTGGVLETLAALTGLRVWVSG